MADKRTPIRAGALAACIALAGLTAAPVLAQSAPGIRFGDEEFSPEDDQYITFSREGGVVHHNAGPDVREPTAVEEARAVALAEQIDALTAEGREGDADPMWRELLQMTAATVGTDHPEASYVYEAYARTLMRQSRLSEAEDMLRHSLRIIEQRALEPYARAGALLNIATVLNMQDRHEEALPYLNRAYDSCVASTETRAASCMSLRGVLADTLDSLGRDDEAIALRREALAALRSDGRGVLDQGVAAITFNLASALTGTEPDEADRLLREVEVAVRSSAVMSRSHMLGGVLLTRANLAIGRGDDIQGEALFREALLFGQTRHSSIERGANTALGSFLAHRGRYREALVHARAARSAEVRDAAARDTNDAAMRYIAGDHAPRSFRFAKIAWLARGDDRDLTIREDAFAAIQDASVSVAARALAQGAARNAAASAGLGPVVTRWRAAQREITALDRQIAAAAERGAGGDTDRRALETSRGEVAARLEADADTLQRCYPRFFDLVSAATPSIAQTQAALRENEALFLISPGRTEASSDRQRGLVFAVTREGSAWAELPLEPDALATEITALQNMLSPSGRMRSPGDARPRGPEAFDRARAHRLYEALFGADQIERLIAGKTSWVLAPQGALVSAPFAALVMTAPAGDNADPNALRDTSWLGIARALSITPSVSTLVAQRAPAPAAQANCAQAEGAQSGPSEPIAFFGIGNPNFSGAANTASAPAPTRSYFRDAAGDVVAIRGLPALPSTGPEIERLSMLLNRTARPGVDYLLGANATETELMARNADGRLGRAEVIAFATHGLVAGNLDNTLAEPALALTPPRTATDRDDGLLTASEAARLSLRARWIILSACNTAAGASGESEGLTGLARAFLYAGARSLLVSLWPVEDQAAERLTTHAVAYQRDNNSTAAEAMRNAMAELAADDTRDIESTLAHPRVWAPFILVATD